MIKICVQDGHYKTGAFGREYDIEGSVVEP
jgi:hypothetical protein